MWLPGGRVKKNWDRRMKIGLKEVLKLMWNICEKAGRGEEEGWIKEGRRID